MNLKLELHKGDTKMLEGTYTVCDAQSFGHACADAWRRLEAEKFEHATSIGDLMESLGENVLEGLDGATIKIFRA